jgi:hypothetical protein
MTAAETVARDGNIGVGVMPRGTEGQVKVVNTRSVGDRRRRRDRFFWGSRSKPVSMCGPFPLGQLALPETQLAWLGPVEASRVFVHAPLAAPARA